jgi:hypothetical protein
VSFSRGETRPSGWTSYVCSKCGSVWDAHAHENPPTEADHTEAECLQIQQEDAHLKTLPRGTYARCVNGGFLKIG